jgi:hypothetical protein
MPQTDLVVVLKPNPATVRPNIGSPVPGSVRSCRFPVEIRRKLRVVTGLSSASSPAPAKRVDRPLDSPRLRDTLGIRTVAEHETFSVRFGSGPVTLSGSLGARSRPSRLIG